MNLIKKNKKMGFNIIDLQFSKYIKLSINDTNIFFSPSYFEYKIYNLSEDKSELIIELPELESKLGVVGKISEKLIISKKMHQAIDIIDGSIDLDIYDIYKEPEKEFRDKLDPWVKGLGLRKMIRNKDKEFFIDSERM